MERRRVRVIDHERRHGNGSVADGGVVGVRADAFDELLFMQPVVMPSAGVGAGLEYVARDF